MSKTQPLDALLRELAAEVRKDLGRAFRIALRPEEAAAALGVSRDHFDQHIAPDLRVIRRGRLKLYAVRELEGWAEANGARVIE